ncbi:MAG: hypothetical protein V4509_03805 [Patescibacteria group bacterium]
MKKFLISFLVFSILTLVTLAHVASADTTANNLGVNYDTLYNNSTAGIPNPLGDKTNSLQAFFMGILSICIQLGTIVAVLAIMYGGFLYVTAQGDEEKLGKAYKTITWALVGTAILLGSRTIMAAVTDTVKQLGTGINN